MNRAGERGSLSIWIIMWMLCLLFIAGFGLDLWRGCRRSSQRHRALRGVRAACCELGGRPCPCFHRASGRHVILRRRCCGGSCMALRVDA